MLKHVLILISLILSFSNSGTVFSQESVKVSPDRETGAATAHVRIDGKALFPVRGVSAFPARERASAIAGRIEAIADDSAVRIESIIAVETDNSIDIKAGDRFVMSVFDSDAESDGVNRQVLAKVYISKIKTAIENYRRDRSSGSMIRNVSSTLGATLVLVILLLLVRFLFRWTISIAEGRFTQKIRQLQEKSHDIVRTEWIWTLIKGGLNAARIIIILLLVFFYINAVLHLFPWTRAYAIPLLELVLKPLTGMLGAFIGYLPSLVFVIILVFLTRYALVLLRAFFQGIERGKIKFAGFEPSWAIPMYKLVRIAVIAFAVVVAYPYIPGSESPAFKGVSLFLGLVFSLGSSSSISQAISGYMVIFSRAFKVGDRVKIGPQTGDVTEMRLLVTHLRTIKNEEIIIPNSTILNTEVVNYSSLAKKKGLILHTTVTIGYDTPWRQVHAMLLMAAEQTPGLLKEPKPFMLQTALNDFYVSYELNAYTDRPLEMVKIYSDLHQNIQDAFNEFGVQIMSPHYLGDPKEAKIVPKEKWHQPPAKHDE